MPTDTTTGMTTDMTTAADTVTTADNSERRPAHVPVLIVGAGIAGLSTALFLGLHGVPALVVERHRSTSVQPKARGQNSTVMEALRTAGIDREVAAAGLDITQQMNIVIGSTVTSRPFTTLVESFDYDVDAVSPVPMAMTSQERFEPILLHRARELGAVVDFNTELTDLTVAEDGITAELLQQRTGTRRTVRADYLVAADGWRSTTRQVVGIGAHGHGSLSHWIAALVRADLGTAFADRAFTLVYLQNPALRGGTGAFVSTDEPGRYVFTVPYDPERESTSDFTAADCIEQVRIAVGVEDLDVEVINLDETEYVHRIADRFRSGRVLLAGDAAHVMPPTGGQGGNTAVHDGIDLGWKLAMIIKGQAGPGLLDSYDAERRPFAERVAEYQLQNMQQRMTPDGVDSPGGEADLDPIDLMFGGRVLDGAICPEPDDDHELIEQVRTADSRPGSRAQHVWLERAGERISTRDLFGRSFVILTADSAWKQVAQEVAQQLGVPLDVQVIGSDDLVDPSGGWAARYGLTDVGASLVRPDGFVAWRSKEAADRGALCGALCRVLDLNADDSTALQERRRQSSLTRSGSGLRA